MRSRAARLLVGTACVLALASTAHARKRPRAPAAPSASTLALAGLPTGNTPLTEKATIFPRALRDALLTQRYDQAVKLLEPIAAGGKAEAMAALGSVLLNLPDATKDVKRAEKLITDAAARGYDPAYKMLAQLYYTGAFNNGTPQYSKAWSYIYPLAQKDDPTGLYLGGRIIRDGLLGSPNDAIGRQMILQAAAKGSIEAQREIGRISRISDAPAIVDKTVPQTAFAAMDAEARKGNIEANLQLGIAYLLGFGTNTDTERARPYLEQAQTRGDLTSAVILDYLRDGTTLSDRMRATIGRAADRAGLGYAVLSRRALEGRGIEKNFDDALFFGLVAGYLGSPDASDIISESKLLAPGALAAAETRFADWRARALGETAK